MDIILARSPNFDAVISQESSEGKGDGQKVDQEGLMLSNPTHLLEFAYSKRIGFLLQHGLQSACQGNPVSLALQLPGCCVVRFPRGDADV